MKENSLALLALLNTICAGPGNFRCLTKEQCPEVKFYDKATWRAVVEQKRKENVGSTEDIDDDNDIFANARGATQAHQGVNVRFHYLEDKDGNPVDGHTVLQLSEFGHAVFCTFSNSQANPLKSFGVADHIFQESFFHEMHTKFETFRYCANDWKAHAFATRIYPTFRQGLNCKAKQALEAADTDDDNKENKKLVAKVKVAPNGKGCTQKRTKYVHPTNKVSACEPFNMFKVCLGN